MKKRLLPLLLIVLCAPVWAAIPPKAKSPRYAEAELLVKFQGGSRGRVAEQAQAMMKHKVLRRFDFIGWQRIKLPKGLTMKEGLEQYRKLPGALAVEPNAFLEKHRFTVEPAGSPTGVMPNDPLYDRQWNMEMIEAEFAWDISTGSSNIVVAIIDDGVYYPHKDLAPNMWYNPGEIPGNGMDDDLNGYVDDIHGINSFVGSGDPIDLGNDGDFHGTLIAGIIGATGNNGEGVAGVNWSVRIMAIRIFGSGLSALISASVEGFEYVHMMKERGVDIRVTNNSYGGTNFVSLALEDAMTAVGNQGILNIIAAGNSSQDNDANPDFPSNYPFPSIISVAASDEADTLAPFSSYGLTNVDLAAPGTFIVSTWGPTDDNPSDTNYTDNIFDPMVVSGTSFSAPHVAGAVALMASVAPQLTGAEIKSAIMQSVDIGPTYMNKMVSHGRLNLRRAMESVAESPPRFVDHPQEMLVAAGFPAQLEAVISGTPPLNLQWYQDDQPRSDQTNATLTFDPATTDDSGFYYLSAMNAFGGATSMVARLTVLEQPLIISEPANMVLLAGQTAAFTVEVQSSDPVSYQWFFNDIPLAPSANIPSVTMATLTLNSPQLSDTGEYSVVVENSFGSVTSQKATLRVNARAIFTLNPVNQSVPEGGTAQFSVTWEGSKPMLHRWRGGDGRPTGTLGFLTALNGIESLQLTNGYMTASQTNSALVLTNVNLTMSGMAFDVVVSNSVGQAASADGILTVIADGDRDGLPDSWETGRPSFNPADPSDAFRDDDGDGVNNSDEYFSGTDYQDDQSYLRIEILVSGGVQMRFQAQSNRTYTLQYTDSLDLIQWKNLMIEAARSHTREVIFHDIDGVANRNYRLVTPASP